MNSLKQTVELTTKTSNKGNNNDDQDKDKSKYNDKHHDHGYDHDHDHDKDKDKDKDKDNTETTQGFRNAFAPRKIGCLTQKKGILSSLRNSKSHCQIHNDFSFCDHVSLSTGCFMTNQI